MSIPFHDRISCTVPEACAATGIGRSKHYEEIAAGRLQTTCVGRRRLILERDDFRLNRRDSRLGVVCDSPCWLE
jgi:excisionase family DNA binding protein